tara:strand:- start:6846 stop:7025 length:180 start_codon:yes stop_codon:yes gene_type:complete
MDLNWKYYSMLGLFIVLYTIVKKPKGNTLKYMWLGYAILAAFIGFFETNKNKENKKNIN